MAIDLTNTAEGGTTGTTVSAGNSGGASGDALTPSIPSGAVVQFLAAAANRGTLGYALTQVANAAAFLQWQPSGQAAPAAAARCYYKRPSALPTQPEPLVQLRPSSGLATDLRLGTDGRLFVISATGATLTTFPTVLTADTWYRLEIRAVKGTGSSDGQVAAAVYLGDSTTSVDAAYSATNVNAGTTDIGTVRFGRASSSSGTYSGHFDNLAFSTGRTTFIGPALGAPPVATVTTSAGTVIAATSALGGSGSTGTAITYDITQDSGPSQAPVQIQPGVWFVVPDSTTARVYTVTVSQPSDSQTDEETVTVAPASATNAGATIRRRRMIGGVLSP